jgi:hypothetical protein
MTYTSEELVAAADLYPSTWVIAHDIKNEVGLPLDFSKRKFLIDIYNDLAPLQAILKPPQVGCTVAFTLKSFYVAKKLGRQIIYTLPTQSDVQAMVGGSFNRIIAQNPILQEWCKDHDTVEQKQVGDSMIFYRGTFMAKAAMMIPSGLNIHDEVDASNASVVTDYENRLQAQEDGGWRWYFSHPSVAGHGVDVYWQKSDKKEWFIQCPNCSEEFVLEWPRNIDPERECYQCHKCHSELPDATRINGEWRKTAEGEFSGYHMSQLMLYNKTAKNILDAFNDPMKDEQYFYNYVLGLPYVGSENKIAPSVVLKNLTPEINRQEGRIIIGVDTGLPIHYVIGNKQGIFYYGKCKAPSANYDPYNDLEKFLIRWKQAIIVSDQGGDLIGIRKLQAKYPGRVFLVYYQKDRKTKEIIRWGDDEEYGTVKVDRNRMFQLMIEQLRDVGRIPLNGNQDEWQDFADQFDNVYRELVTSRELPGKDVASNYGVEFVWKRSGADHHCFVSGTKIKTNSGSKPIEDIEIGDFVLTRNGYKKVYDTGESKYPVAVYTAYFSDGTVLTATPDHPFITSKGTLPLAGITPDAILYSCQNLKASNMVGSFIGDTQALKGEKRAYTLCRMGHCEKEEQKDSISKYGWMSLEKFLKDISSTIKTVIRLITTLQTWCVRQSRSIKAITQLNDYRTVSTGSEMKHFSKKYDHYRTLGDTQRKAKNGIVNMLLKVVYSANLSILYVLSAILKQLHAARKAASSVPQDVVLVGMHENGAKSILNTGNDTAKRKVFNISVEDNHEYFANGILVSNCHCLLYTLVGLDRFGNDGPTFIPAKRDDVFTGIATGTRPNGEMPARRIIPRGYVDF